MKQDNVIITKTVFKVLTDFGNLFLRRPPWIKESYILNNKARMSNQYSLWRNAVLKRDNCSCIKCGEKRIECLQADHIKPFSLFPELRFAIDNGRTLCIVCHKKTGTYGGKVKKWKR